MPAYSSSAAPASTVLVLVEQDSSWPLAAVVVFDELVLVAVVDAAGVANKVDPLVVLLVVELADGLSVVESRARSLPALLASPSPSPPAAAAVRLDTRELRKALR